MQSRCKEALVAVFGQPKVDEFPEPLLKLMEQLYCIAHKDGISQVRPAATYDENAFHEGMERGYYEARQELMHQMDEKRWQQEQAMAMKMKPTAASMQRLFFDDNK